MPTRALLKRTTRSVTATYEVTDAPPIKIWHNMAVPFEAELTWINGALSSGVLVRAHKLKRDGTVGLAVVARFLYPGDHPDWLAAVVAAAVEPGPGS